MQEHLMNIREAAEFLSVGERRIKELVDRGEIPAYKIGGTFLRFKKSQLAIFKTTLLDERRKDIPEEAVSTPTGAERMKDFFYFNDFYILSAVVIFIAVVLIIAT